MFDNIEELLQVQIQHPIHFPFTDSKRQCIECIVLAPAWPKAVGESHKVRFVDLIEQRHRRLLRDFVLYALNTQRPLCPVFLGQEYSPSRFRDVASVVYSCMQID